MFAIVTGVSEYHVAGLEGAATGPTQNSPRITNSSALSFIFPLHHSLSHTHTPRLELLSRPLLSASHSFYDPFAHYRSLLSLDFETPLVFIFLSPPLSQWHVYVLV